MNSLNTSDKFSEIVKEYDPATAADVQSFLTLIKEHLNSLTEKSWTTFFITVADTGLELLSWKALNDQPAVWPVPALFIQGDERLSGAIESFWKPSELRQRPGTVLRVLNDRSFQATLPRSYVYALCYRLLFAHAERWPLTRLLAQRAIRISRQLRLERGNPHQPVDDDVHAIGNVPVSGREAAYLLAVSTRVNAQEPGELSDAYKALQISISAPSDFADAAENAGMKVTGLRFEAENVAIEQALLLARGEQPDISLIEALRGRIIAALGKADICEQELVRTHAEIALRSEYFLSLRFSVPGSDRDAFDEEVADSLAAWIEEQVSDIEFVYADAHRSGLELAPLRDRALLRLAATYANDPGLLPDWMLESTLQQDRHAPVGAMRPVDRRYLVVIEREIDRIQKLRPGPQTFPLVG